MAEMRFMHWSLKLLSPDFSHWTVMNSGGAWEESLWCYYFSTFFIFSEGRLVWVRDWHHRAGAGLGCGFREVVAWLMRAKRPCQTEVRTPWSWPARAGHCLRLLSDDEEWGGTWTVLFFPRTGSLPGFCWHSGGVWTPDHGGEALGISRSCQPAVGRETDFPDHFSASHPHRGEHRSAFSCLLGPLVSILSSLSWG